MGVQNMDKHITTPITAEVTKNLKSGDYVYITGTIYVARDAAHKRMIEALERGEKPSDRHQRFHNLLHGTIPGKRGTSDRFCRTDNCNQNG